MLMACCSLWCDINKLTSLPERISEMKSLRKYVCARVGLLFCRADGSRAIGLPLAATG